MGAGNKKSQVAGQVFIYLLAAVLFAMIITYGYGAIRDFVERGEQVTLIQFKTDLRGAVKSLASTQDLERNDMVLPKGVVEVCFIDLRYGLQRDMGDPEQAGIRDKSQIMFDSWQDGVEQNVFLLPMAEVPIYIGKIELAEDGEKKPYICIETKRHRVSLQLEGRGDRTVISEWKKSE